MVIVFAFGVTVMAWSVFEGQQRLSEHGLAASLGTDLLVLTVAVFLFMGWLLIRVVRRAVRAWPTAAHGEITSRKVCAGLREVFTGQATEVRPAYRYGMLAAILALLAWDIQWLLNLPPNWPHGRYGNLMVGLMLLFNHLAFSFRWSATVTFAWRVLAIGWLVMVFFF